jgi:hypothetical protein
MRSATRPLLHRMAAWFVLGTVIFASHCDMHARQNRDSVVTYRMENSHVRCTVTLTNGRLTSDRLEILPNGSSNGKPAVESDADFGLDIMYTGWDAPGKANNADNIVMFTKEQFTFVEAAQPAASSGEVQELRLLFKGVENPIRLMVTYQLTPDVYYAKRRIAVLDTTFGHHFLRWFWPRRGTVSEISDLIKAGGFGQPVAARVGKGSMFFGLEYPASQNSLEQQPSKNWRLECGEEIGERIGAEWLASDWVVECVTPDPFVKNWFERYLADIRVAPLRPYTLYNSWYDLRSPEYPRVPPENFMSEQSAMKMVNILRKNMMEKHNITLDAFVLDDGWDVYKSDWVLRKEQWPNGLKPLADELKRTNTSLGIWFGPTGGYSFRDSRITWMKEHGYEVVGDQMCVGGTNYGSLLTKRVTDFARNDGVNYFKWDGIQFSCSEPNHGHPTDVYSRRAILNRIAIMSRSVREKNPGMFLNITSGTWMSPWWLALANTIWMQGGDYGFADVPSITKRDASSTYRDFVLYDDLRTKDLWFPIANLMTHGIIKGKIHSVGSNDEPLDKFTDDALLYFARGVSMHELYVSPDILSEGEWQSISDGLAWARDRFNVLMRTEMVGGNPMKGEAYGYVHYAGAKGIIALRNPVIDPISLRVDLSQADGLDPEASSLVLERVYPTRWISPRLYRTGDRLTLPLDGFETAVYELYPIASATEPLLAGVSFDNVSTSGSTRTVQIHSVTSDATVLNPTALLAPSDDMKLLRDAVKQLRLKADDTSIARSTVRGITGGVEVNITVPPSIHDGVCALLFLPDSTVKGDASLSVSAIVDGKPAEVKSEHQEGRAQWFTVSLVPGQHVVIVAAGAPKDTLGWRGRLQSWFIGMNKNPFAAVSLTAGAPIAARVLPPHPWAPAETRVTRKLGETMLTLQRLK